MVICKVPKAGLGNQLFPLLKAYIFGSLNNQPVKVIGYHQWRIGSYLRREKSKRKYTGYFSFQKNLAGEWIDRLCLKRVNQQSMLIEPPLQKIDSAITPKPGARYMAIPHWDDFFAGLREHRNLGKQILWKLLRPLIREKIENGKIPCIGVHIRMGDFRKLKSNEDFKNVGLVRTPETYFVDVISGLRQIHGSQLPATIFTDGYRHEFKELFKLEHVSICEGNPDIVDMFLLSRSSIVVTSAGSTFSYWSGFLSEAPVILHPDHIHARLRSASEYGLYEGPVDPANELLVSSIKKIKYPAVETNDYATHL